MKRLIACASLVAAATTAAVPSTTPVHHAAAKPAHPAAKIVAKAAPRCKVAPADEYFGKLKMSILGIRNTLKDQGLKVDNDPEKAPTTLNAISLTEDAIHDWQHKYPCDTWLPGSIYALEHFYTKIHTDDGVRHVHAAYAWLRHDFPKHRLVQLARNDDGSATAAPAIASAASGAAAASAGAATSSASAPGAGSAASGTTGAAAAATQTASGGMPMQSQATPVPGLAPQSVINAQGTSAPAPH
ncbi:MAG: hypothetical protein NVS3B7_07370 [Candidatus Elarobacter sp.]